MGGVHRKLSHFRSVEILKSRSGEIGFGISQLQDRTGILLLQELGTMPLIFPSGKAGELMSGCGICDGTTTKVPESCRKLLPMPRSILPQPVSKHLNSTAHS